MKNRFISLCLILVMLLTATPIAAAANPGFSNFKVINTYKSGQFSDVPSDGWYADNVREAYELGLVKGTSDTQFNPMGNITVAETLALACRLHSVYHGKGSDFQQGDPWYQVYVDYATEKGILDNLVIKNYSDRASREVFAFLFAKALPAKALPAINTITDGQIPDVSASNAVGRSIYMLYNAGILTGSDKYGTFNPTAFISRAEVATMAVRMAKQNMRVQFTPEEKLLYPTSQEMAVLPSFISSMTKCKTALDDLYTTWKSLYSNPDSSVQHQAHNDLAQIKTMIDTMVSKYEGYEYYSEIVNGMRKYSSNIGEFLQYPVFDQNYGAVAFGVNFYTGLTYISNTRDLIGKYLNLLNSITMFS